MDRPVALSAPLPDAPRRTHSPLLSARRVALRSGGRDNITVAILPVDIEQRILMTTISQRDTLTIEGGVHQNLYLPMDGPTYCVLTLTPRATSPAPADSGQAAEVLVLDGSGSMDVDLRDVDHRGGHCRHRTDPGRRGVRVITAANEATMLWPPVPELG